MTFLIVALCLLLGIGVYAGLMASGILPGQDRDERPSLGGGGGVFPQAPHLRELPQGCLIVLILAALAWFAAWGIVLVMALNLLSSTT
ncbi:MAG: hypothetical protein KY412_00500 [Actinobacteria bacterium]|nr:hypothetical protein [Actinomycetota bacterium]MBW3644117.1 hypothetical protein [Actinomycetota bacterium]